MRRRCCLRRPLVASLSLLTARDNTSTIADAEGVADFVEEHKASFVSIGFPEDFVEKLRRSAADLRVGIDARASDFGRRSASTAALRQQYARGRSVVRILDAMVSPHLERSPSKLAEWRTISRFARLSAPDEAVGPPSAPVLVVPPATPAPIAA
ncbi:MAG: hypothetical protein IT361_15110 [Gemmatimonadaceae bacterium]|nr:hypothetical protein [Gemmatimonadaceae bacterium]